MTFWKNYSETNSNATCANYSRMSTAKIESLDNDELRRRVTDIREQIQESVAPEKARIAEIKDNIESVEYDERENMWEEVDKIEKTILDKYEKALDDALPQVFALVKATSKRFAEN